MAVDRKEIDLIIRAALEGKNNLTTITKSITDLEKAIDGQSAAAKRGEASIDELKGSLLALQQVQDRLKDQAALIGQYDRLTKQIATAAERADKAAVAYAEFNTTLNKSAAVTERQQDRLIKLSLASERAATTLERQKTQQAALGNELRKSGIELDKIAGAESRVRQSAAQLGATILKTQQAISTYADDVRKARDAERELAATAVFNRKAEEAAKLVKASDYISFWEVALRDADVAQERFAVNSSLKQAANEAVASARGYQTLARAIQGVNQPSVSFRETIQGIIEPSRQARATLQGVESEIADISAAVSNVAGPIADYREQLQRLRDVQRALTGQASLVDEYNRQVQALKATRAEYVAARTDVLQYAAALQQSSGENQELAASLRNAQTRLEAAAKGLQLQITQTRQLRASAREAGIATNDLAGSQQRLINATRSATQSMKSLEEANRRYGQSARANADTNDFFNNSGRTTLSLLQRIRGEILALTASYVGLFGAIQGATSAIEAYNTKQAIQNQLALSVGNDPAAIAAEYQYIQEQADRIGVSFEVAARGYAKFSAAASLAGRDAKEIRFIFESFTEVARVANVSSDNLDGIFKALEQIISKGKIQAEELRGQLGDRLFGAFQIAAKALKDQFPNLDQALKNGLVTSEQLVAIAEEYRRTVAEGLPNATKTLAAEQARLNSALFEFKTLVAEQGFADEYKNLVTTLITFFQSSDGAEFAKDISDGFSVVVRVLRFLVENLELVQAVLVTGLGILGIKAVIGLGSAFVVMTAKMALAKTGTDALALSQVRLLKGFAALSLLMATWQFAEYLVAEFAVVNKAIITIGSLFEKLYVSVKLGAQIFWEEYKNLWAKGLALVINGLTSGLRTLLGVMSASARALGNTDLADSIDRALSVITIKTKDIGDASKKLREQLTKDLKAIDDVAVGAFAEIDKDFASRGAGRTRATGSTGRPEGVIGAVDPEAAAEEAEKRIEAKEKLENSLLQIEARIEKNEKDSLSRRLAAIDIQYTKLLNDIRKLGGAEGAVLEARLNDAVASLKIQETRKFNDALLKEQEALQTQLENVEVAAGRKSKADLDARLAAVRTSYEDTYRDIDALRDRLEADGRDTSIADESRRRLDAAVIELQNIERRKFALDEIARREAQVNDLLNQRNERIRAINEEAEAGLLTDTQARENASAVVLELQPRIEALTQEALLFAEALNGAVDPAKLELFVSTMKRAEVSGKTLNTELFTAVKLADMLAVGATSAFDNAAEAIGGAVAGTNSWGDAIQGVRNSFIQFAADFLRQIALMIIKQQLLNLLQSSGGGGGFLGAVAGALTGMAFHSGGVVGQGGTPRMVNPNWFSTAPRYHVGGIAGLAPGELPAVLRTNEEILTEDNPRNILNGGAAAGGAQRAQDIKVINMIDSPSVLSEALGSQQGVKVLVNAIRANRTSIKSALG